MSKRRPAGCRSGGSIPKAASRRSFCWIRCRATSSADTPRAFASDPAALALTKLAIERGYDAGFNLEERVFLYLPLEHSEDLADQRLSVEINRSRIGDPEYTDYAEGHLRIIERFGRFPHRNRILGRPSTEEEIEFLKQPGSSF